MTWEPTNELRWVNRYISQERFHHHGLRETVLQQKWKWKNTELPDNAPEPTEWRDVPEATEGGEG